MTAKAIRRLLVAVAMTAGVFVLGACGEDKEAQAEIERLTETLETLEEDLLDSRRECKRVTTQNDERGRGLNEAKKNLRTAESKLTISERALKRYRDREEREKERATAAKEKEPSRMEKREIAKKAATKNLGAVVDIKGDRSKGVGFLVEDGGKTWIYFAARMLAGNSKLEISGSGGEVLDKFGAFEVAADVDLARLEVLEAPEEKLVVAEPGELESGTPLLGVNESRALVEGRSYEATASELRADSRIGASSVGTPVFHGETGALLGFIASPAEADRDLWGGRNSPDRRQRSVSRLDRKMEWQPMPIGTFLGEARQIADADRLTRVVHAFAVVRVGENGLDLEGTVKGGQSALEIFKKNKTLSAVRSLFELDKWLEEKGDRASEADLNRRIDSVYSAIARTSGSQTRKLQDTQFSPFHQAAVKQSLKWRKEAQEELGETIKELKE